MRIITTTVGLSLLSGCVAPQIDAGRYVVDYNRVVEIEANETTLLNIMRAYHRAPTHYTSIQSISAELTASQTLEAGLTAAEGAVTETRDGAGNPTGISDVEFSSGGSAGYTLVYGQEPTFSIASLNTQEFAQGTSSPIAVSTFNNFLAEGYRSQMLIALLVDTIEVVDLSNGSRRLLANNPNGMRRENDCRAHVFELLRDNLDVAPRSVAGSRALIARLHPAAPNAELIASLDELIAQGFIVTRSPDGSALLRGPAVGGRTGMRLEHNGLSSEAIGEIAACVQSQGRPPEDKSVQDDAQTGSFTIGDSGQSFRLRFAFRSPDGVTYAAGEYLRHLDECRRIQGRDTGHSLGPIVCSEVFVGSDRDPLLVVNSVESQSGVENAMVHTEYAGAHWMVPPGTNHRSMQVINIIQTLINLNRSADELRTPNFFLLD